MMTICYKTVKPKKYDSGELCDEFLAYYALGATKEEAEHMTAEINEKKPEIVGGEVVDWSNIKYFFAYEQEEFY